jgi:hypothetical protein
MPSQQIRIWIAVALACCAIVLFVFSRPGEFPGPSTGSSAAPRNVASGPAPILKQVEAVVARFHVAPNAMRVIAPARGGSGVPEVRLQAGPDFSSYEFHCALAAAVADMDVSVSGIENVRAKTTALRIVRDTVTIVLVNLDMRTPPQQPRKESSH